MINYDENIGKNMRTVRIEKGMSQQAVADKCKISNTVISAYENYKKVPSLSTIALIAKALGVSIERLYYGDENNLFVNSVPDVGRKVVNSIYLLWSLDIISYYEHYSYGAPFTEEGNAVGVYLPIEKFAPQIKRLIHGLNEYKEQFSTYNDPKAYLEMLLSSSANEINKEIEKGEA